MQAGEHDSRPMEAAKSLESERITGSYKLKLMVQGVILFFGGLVPNDLEHDRTSINCTSREETEQKSIK